MSARGLITGTALASAANIIRVALQALALPVLARFLSPEDYGLASMAMPFIVFMMMLADTGLASSLIRQTEITHREASSCNWSLIVLGLALGAGLALLTPLVARLYDEPRLTLPLAALCLVVPLQTATAVPGALLLKEQRYLAIALGEVLATLFSIGTAVALAIAGEGVVALVAQQLVFYVVRVVTCYATSRFRPVLVLDLSLVRGHSGFARDTVSTNVVAFVSKSLENMIIGRVLGAHAVGVFSLAFQLGRVPWMIVAGPFTSALYPHLVRMRDDRQALAASALLYTRLLATAVLPMMTIAVLASEPLIRVFLSEKWLPARPLFEIMGPAMALAPVTAILGTFMMTLGRTDVGLKVAAGTTAAWIPVAAILAPFGLEALAAGFTLVNLAGMAWSLKLSLGILGIRARDYLDSFWRPILLTALAAFSYVAISRSLALDSQGLIVLAGGLLVLAGAFAAVMERADFTQLRAGRSARGARSGAGA